MVSILITNVAVIAVLFSIGASAYGQVFMPSPRDRQVIPAACSAVAPKAGEIFSGTVLEIVDGGTICVAQGPTPDRWILVKLAGARSGQTKGALAAATFAKHVSCVAHRSQGQGLISQCTIDGLDINTLLHSSAVLAAGREWR